MKRILVVDDDSLIRYSLSAAFQDRDTEIITRPDSRTGLKALGDWLFDLCFLDIQLPDGNGVDMLRMIRQLSPKTKIIMMTGSQPDAAAMRTIRENAFLFLAKPFDLFRVKRVLDALNREDENAFQNFEELETRVAERRRDRRRQAAAKQITFVTVPSDAGEKEDCHKGDLVDISDRGTRIRTAHHLKPGSMIRFRNSVNEAAGVVRWSATDKEKNDRYVAGIQLIGREGG
ncbi:MAG: hypothetical protein A2010_02365 [Nitrospirae bacterium GWD2_57_9]|nr:MAG: hypothetical protein A2010_02365 [Nitrospirae bacterium GWD2_57_9]